MILKRDEKQYQQKRTVAAAKVFGNGQEFERIICVILTNFRWIKCFPN